MKLIGTFAAAALIVILCQHAMGGPASRPASAPAAGPLVPTDLLDKMDGLAQPPEPGVPPAEAIATLRKGLQAILDLGAQAEKDYPSAANLHMVRMRMIQAADMLRRLSGGKEHEKQVLDIAHRVLGSDCPAEFKAQADWLVTGAKVREARLKGAEAAEEVRKYAARYAESNAAPNSLAFAVVLARNLELKDLAKELTDKLEADYGDVPEAKDLLRRLGRHPDVGKPFAAELTTLDGKKLSLPKDLIGKVVVVDFWASWCPPCVEEIPHLKQVRQKYAAKGVEIVGISLDRTKAAAEKFTKENKMDWIQTYDGPLFPAAEKYGVEAIPSVWVIGKDGKVVSDNAGGSLEETLEKALAAPSTAPAGGPAKTN